MWVKALAHADLWDGEMKALELSGRRVLLVKVADAIRAYDDRCPHKAVALSQGKLEGSTLTCSGHHWQFDAVSGRGLNPTAACLKSFPVKIEGDDVFVELDAVPGSGVGLGVGPVLLRNEVSLGIAEVVRALNPTAVIVDRGAYLRITVPDRCVLTRRAIEERLGRAFHLPGDLEKVMCSFAGHFSVTEDEAVWEKGERKGSG